eukprot:TRINITY_DN9071_c0_g1_i1.p1 TRINITY_DN9071_c0_g1~~TRINITY_DN9071_c0_g1_i1.p1  ORF type:complete len:160 (-),score=12.06 TRINITY_DN9071_c0_g1_i1:106-585(-)
MSTPKSPRLSNSTTMAPTPPRGSASVTSDLLTCSFTISSSGTYNLTSSDVLTTTTACSFSDCSGDTACASICDLPCDDSDGDGTATAELVFTSDCDSFSDEDGDTTFTKKTSYWWVWLLVSLAVVACIGVTVAAVVGVGFVFWKKKQQASAPSFDTFGS